RSNVQNAVAYHWRPIGYTWNRRSEMFDSKMLIVVLLIALVIFGTKRLRSIGSDLGAGVKGFQSGLKRGGTEEAAKQLKQDKDADFAPSAATRESEAKVPPKTNA